MHPTFAQLLTPFAPPQSNVHLNDDDLYVVDIRTKRILQQHRCKSAQAKTARTSGINVQPGQALLTGIQARSFGAQQ